MNQQNMKSESGGASGIGVGGLGDSWAHRSQGMRCKTCMWFVAKAGQENDYGQDPKRLLGRCRRHAPTMNGFPAVFTDDWCGDHKLDETKI